MGQMGQDKFLDKIVFKGMERGIFVDVGAHDGKSLSNTFFLEKERKWTGLCIEPNPRCFDLLTKERSSDCLKVAIDTKEGKAKFLKGTGYVEMLCGIVDHMDPRHYNRILHDAKEHNATVEMDECETRPLSSILEEKKINHINYLSIDVEGGEFAVLDSLDFSKVFIDVIEVECNFPDHEARFKDHLAKHGYELMLILDWDLLFINTQSTFYKNLDKEKLPMRLSIHQPPWKHWRELPI